MRNDEWMAEDTAFLNDPRQWPMGAICPVKIYDQGRGEGPRHGFVALDPQTRRPTPVVFLLGIHEINSENLENCHKEKFISVEEMVRSGWMVD